MGNLWVDIRFGTRMLVAAALAVRGFSQSAAQQPTFRSAVRTVPVYATVSDREGRLVPNLEKEQFRILDNGRPVNIGVFSNQPQPITVAVMLDMGGSMGVRIARVRRHATVLCMGNAGQSR